MRVLVVESYYGGSHKAFLDGWIRNSVHEFDLITFPAYKWKWRMRHSAVSAALEVNNKWDKGDRWDVLFVSDMLGLAEFCGLLSSDIAALPRVMYFHENQLLYPDSRKHERDLHYAYTNFTGALAASAVWFNTDWHRREFIQALNNFLKRMPDYQHLLEVDNIARSSRVIGQGISEPAVIAADRDSSEVLRLIWAARWEHDKNPEDLYNLLKLLVAGGVDFIIDIIGESFSVVPDIFSRIKSEFGAYIGRFGYQESRQEYYTALSEADIILSTAVHEFFGISIIEGCACGAIPLAPDRLAYPEVLAGEKQFLYGTTAVELYERIITLEKIRGSRQWHEFQERACSIAARYYWPRIAAELDSALEDICV